MMDCRSGRCEGGRKFQEFCWGEEVVAEEGRREGSAPTAPTVGHLHSFIPSVPTHVQWRQFDILYRTAKDGTKANDEGLFMNEIW